MTMSMGSKRLGLLRDLLPRATRVAVLVDPNDDAAVVKSMIADVRGAGRSIGRYGQHGDTVVIDDQRSPSTCATTERDQAIRIGAVEGWAD
jgi:hypothetical protein